MNNKIGSLLCVLALVVFPSLEARGQDNNAMPRTVEFLGLTAPLADAWIEKKPSSTMRLAQFVVPGGNGRGDAELILYFFGLGQGGSAEANIARWQSQFTTSGGGAVDPHVETMTVSNMPVTVVELKGDYARGVGMGSAAAPKPDQVLLATILESPRGNVYIQLHGPAQAVSMHRQAYMHFIRNIKPIPNQPSDR